MEPEKAEHEKPASIFEIPLRRHTSIPGTPILNPRQNLLAHGDTQGTISIPGTPPSSTSSEEEDDKRNLQNLRRRKKTQAEDDSSSESDEEEAGQKSVDKIVGIIGRRLEEKLKAEEENEAELEPPAGATNWMFAVLFLLVVLALCHTAAAVYLFTVDEPYEHPYTCWSKSCRNAAKWLKSTMNDSVDPCDDFFEFTCGKYVKEHPPPKFNKTRPMTFIEGIPYRFKGHEKLGQFLKPVKAYPANQILPFYKSCIFLKRRNKKGYRGFVHLLARLKLIHPITGMAKRPNIARRMVRIFKLTNKMPFIEVQGIVDNYLLIGMGKPNKEVETTNPKLYEQTIRKTFETLRNFLLIYDKEEIDTIVYLVMRFEAELAMLQGKGLSNTVFGFPHQMDKYVKIPKTLHPNYNGRTANFQWDDLIDEMFVREQPPESPNPVVLFNWRDSIMQRSRDDRFYLIILEQHLRRTPWYTIFRYFQWMLMKAFGFELTEDFTRLMSNLYPETGNSGESRCFHSVFSNLNALAAERYMMDVKDFDKVNAQMKRLADLIDSEVMNMSATFLPEIISKEVESTLQNLNVTAVQIKEISPFISTFYRGLNLSDEKYFENVISTRVMKSRNDIKKMRKLWPYVYWPQGSYSLDLITRTDSIDENNDWRILNVPFGAMVEPFVGNDLPVLDIAGYGFWIVSFYSMIYVVSDLLKYVALGRNTHANRDAVYIQTTEKENEIIPRMRCIYDMQAQMELPNIPGFKLNPLSRNARLKNLADPLGVEVLAKMYDRLKDDRSLFPEHQLLPGFEDYEPEQLMYLAIARQGCSTQPAELEKHMLQNGPTPFRLRMNGAFRMQPGFAKAWKCPKKSYMNPTKKCQFFEPLRRHKVMENT